MDILRKISNWFKRDYKISQDKTELDEIDSREFEWCIVGNIIDRHYWGEQKEIRRGTKQFGPGGKVYCMPEFAGMAHEEIRVLGKPRKQKRLINIIMRTRQIKNFRVQKVYHPKIQFDIGSHLYYWNNRRTNKELINLQKMAVYLNTMTEEIDEST